MADATDGAPGPAVRQDGRRAKYLTLLALVAGSGFILLASTQSWFVVHLTDVGAHTAVVSVPGSAAAPALTALSLAGLALAAALAIAGPVFRTVLAILGLLLSASVLVSAISALADARQSSSATITSSTGVAGNASIAALINRIDIAFWPWLAVAGGILVALASLAVIVTSRRWPGPSRRYETRFETQDAGVPDIDSSEDDTPGGEAEETSTTTERDRAIDSWDELSRGEDPTR
jgi:uncharacterized membrane protein (TIGR02234 family)